MGSNDLTVLPDSFGAALEHLSNLRSLHLEHIPIKSSWHLTTLQLNDNCLTAMPGSFSTSLDQIVKLNQFPTHGNPFCAHALDEYYARNSGKQ